MGGLDYDVVGAGYNAVRRPDSRFEAHIHRALGDARTVVNVGAGTGSYEPSDREVVAVEPSRLMIAQRPVDAAPAILGHAESIPLADGAVDAAMAVLSIQHWQDVQQGLGEMLRVARDRVVLVTIDVAVLAHMWLVRDYFPEILEVHAVAFPAIDDLLGRLPNAQSEAIPVPADCTDGFLAALWAHPEAHLQEHVRTASSAWHQLPTATVNSGLARLRHDLATGAWDQHYGKLRHRDQLDVGLRLVISHRD